MAQLDVPQRTAVHHARAAVVPRVHGDAPADVEVHVRVARRLLLWRAAEAPGRGCRDGGRLLPADGPRRGEPRRRRLQRRPSRLQRVDAELQVRRRRLHQEEAAVGEQIRTAIQPLLPLPLWTETLSRIALNFVASTPGVSCVLCGMRHPNYVTDALGITRLAPIPDVAAVAQALAERTQVP